MRILDFKSQPNINAGGPSNVSPRNIQPSFISSFLQKAGNVVRPMLSKQYSPQNIFKSVMPQFGLASTYEKKRVIEPAKEGIKQIKQSFDTSQPTLQRTLSAGKGALSLFGAGFNQTPFGASFNALMEAPKAYAESRRSRESFAKNLLAAKEGFTGEREVGLGEAVTSNPLAQKILDYAELPLFLAVSHKVGSIKTQREFDELFRAIQSVKKGGFKAFQGKPEIKIEMITNLRNLSKKHIPKIANSKEMRRLATKDVDKWADVTAEYLSYKLVPPKVNAGLGLSVESKGGTKAILDAEKLKGKVPMQEPKLLEAKLESPWEKIRKAVGEATPLTQEQKAFYKVTRSERFARSSAVSATGEKGFFTEKKLLKGEMPKLQFEGIKKQIDQPTIDNLFKEIRDSANLTYPESIAAREALATILQGGVPIKSQLTLLSKVAPPEFIDEVLSKRDVLEKVIANLGDAVNIPRALMASMDFSASFRQAIFAAPRHPGIFAKAFVGQFKQAFSEKAFQEAQKIITSDPLYALAKESRLGITEIGKFAGKREEAFMSKLAEKIPFVRGSERAYVGFLNKFRFDLFKNIVKSNPELKNSSKFLDDAAGLVNRMTGRGELPNFMKKSAPFLNGVLFSPRLAASRMSLLNPVYYAKLSPGVRKEALQSAVSFVATGMGILGLAKLNGAEVEMNPKSADFGKIKIGNTRYDIWGGFQQYVRFLAQFISGETVSTTTGKVTKLGKGFKPDTRWDLLLRFGEYKTAPIYSLAIAILKQQDFEGKPINIPKEVGLRFVPLVAQDMYDLLQDREFAQAIGMSIPGIFGVGSQTYKANVPTKNLQNIGKIKPTTVPKKPVVETKIPNVRLGPMMQPKK